VGVLSVTWEINAISVYPQCDNITIKKPKQSKKKRELRHIYKWLEREKKKQRRKQSIVPLPSANSLCVSPYPPSLLPPLLPYLLDFANRFLHPPKAHNFTQQPPPKCKIFQRGRIPHLCRHHCHLGLYLPPAIVWIIKEP